MILSRPKAGLQTGSVRSEWSHVTFFFFFLLRQREVANGTCFWPPDGPEKIFWVLWVHGQQFKMGAVMYLGDLALQPLAQTA